MAHGKFTEENDIFIMALYMGTSFKWKKIQDEFRARFKSKANHKDIESRWYKRLKGSELVLAVDDFRHTRILKDDQHRDAILAVVAVLAAYSAAERAF